jgi:hypothetical protein
MVGMALAGYVEAMRLRLVSYVIGIVEFADNAHINLRTKYGWDGRRKCQLIVPLDGKVWDNPSCFQLRGRSLSIVSKPYIRRCTYLLCFSLPKA